MISFNDWRKWSRRYEYPCSSIVNRVNHNGYCILPPVKFLKLRILLIIYTEVFHSSSFSKELRRIFLYGLNQFVPNEVAVNLLWCKS